MTKLTKAAVAFVALTVGCAEKGNDAMKDTEVPIACRMNALSREQRAREGELLREHLATTVEVRERPDGYSFRYAPDPSLFTRIAELTTLEHRCCPFLDFQLEWAGTGEPWLHVTGGARVKSFVADTFIRRDGARSE